MRSASRPRSSYFGVLGEIERVFDIDAEIADRALDFDVTQEDLDGPKIAGGLVDDRMIDAFVRRSECVP